MLKILLAEDNPVDESALIQYLRNNLGDFTHETVKSCKEMLKVLEEGNEFDIIIWIIYWKMSNLLKYIDKIVSKKSQGSEIIVLSGQSDISVCIQYLNAGVYAYLNKEANAFKNMIKNINEIISKKKGDLGYFKVNKSLVYVFIAAAVILTGFLIWILS